MAPLIAEHGDFVQDIAFEVDDPTALVAASPVGDGTWVIAPEDNLGTRLVLEPR